MTTTNKVLAQPSYNSSTPTWDQPLNNNFSIIDTALGSTATISSTVSLTLSTAQYQCARLLFNGSLSANITATVPIGIGGFWIISNATTDASAAVPCYVTIASGGAGAYVNAPRGTDIIVYSDGSNIYVAPANGMPTGSVINFAGTSAPYGYLSCDGTAYSRSTYAALYAAIGTTWGAGNGTTTFNVPDLRGMFLRGTGTNATGSSSGAVGPSVGAYAADTYLNHSHTATSTDSGHTHTIGSTGPNGAGGGGLPGFGTSTTVTTNTGNANITTTVAASTTGGTETKPKNYGVLYCIKF